MTTGRTSLSRGAIDDRHRLGGIKSRGNPALSKRIGRQLALIGARLKNVKLE